MRYCQKGIDSKPRPTISGPRASNSGTGSCRIRPRAINSRPETFDSRSSITRSPELGCVSKQFHVRCEELNNPFDTPIGALDIPNCLQEIRFWSFRIPPKPCWRFESQMSRFRGVKTGLECMIPGVKSVTRNADLHPIGRVPDSHSTLVFANARDPPAELHVCPGRGFTRQILTAQATAPEPEPNTSLNSEGENSGNIPNQRS